jgi:hypothetical protein
MKVHKIDKKIRVSVLDMIKYQLITELIFVKKEQVIPSDIELLALVGLWGPMGLSEFCMNAAKHLNPESKPEEFSLRAQNIRNKLVKLERRGMVIKSDMARKKIMLSPNLNITTSGNLLLNFNILALEPA